MYLIFALINSLAFPPVTGAKNPDYVCTVRKADSHYAFADSPETVVPLLRRAVR